MIVPKPGLNQLLDEDFRGEYVHHFIGLLFRHLWVSFSLGEGNYKDNYMNIFCFSDATVSH